MDFPQEILFFNILPLLPGNSVVRFKCVCKEWYLFLSSPMFKKMHFLGISKDQHQNPHKLLILSDTTPCTFHTIDCEAPELGLTPSRIVPFELNDNKVRILTSFHGLACVGIFSKIFVSYFCDIILWNPLTGDHKTLSKTNCETRWCDRDAFKLHYSSSDNDYKLLHYAIAGRSCTIYMYSLTSNSWTKITSANKAIPCDKSWMSPDMLNENLYSIKPTNRTNKIIRFNTKTDRSTEIKVPIFRRLKNKRSRITLLKGCIHIYLTIIDIWSMDEWKPTVKLWRMDEDENWTPLGKYVPEEGFHHNSRPIHVMKNGNWLMHTRTNTESYFYKVDLEKNTKEKLCSYTDANSDGHGDAAFSIYAGKYLETFVSPINPSIM